jgi:hypothetical protein
MMRVKRLDINRRFPASQETVVEKCVYAPGDFEGMGESVIVAPRGHESPASFNIVMHQGWL